MTSILFFLAIHSQAMPVYAFVWDELNTDQKKAVLNGKQVVLSEETPGSDWPKMTVYQPVRGTPEETAALYWDFKIQKDYVPGCLGSKISKRISPTEVWVDYVAEVPLFGREPYTLDYRLTQTDSGIALAWFYVRPSAHVRSAHGGAWFEEVPNAGISILKYENTVITTPGASFFARGWYIGQVKDTVASIPAQLTLEKSDYPALLSSQLEELERAFDSGEGEILKLCLLGMIFYQRCMMFMLGGV